MPISTLYASPENSSSDLFWAFQPKRATVPSLPLLFAWPEIAWPARTMLGRPWTLSSFFLGASTTWFARIALSGICSIRPAPNTGVGMRKITLRRASSRSKSGCASTHPGASERPAIVDRSWAAPARRAVGVLHEPRLAHRPLRRDERRHAVGRALRFGERDLGIHRRACSAERRLQMAAAAAPEVHRRSEAVAGFFLFLEHVRGGRDK